MANYTLFKRFVSIIATTELGSQAEFGNLDAEFSVEKTVKSNANTCELRIYNLSDTNRKSLQDLGKISVDVRAGYLGPEDRLNDIERLDHRFLIFRGDVVRIYSRKEGPDWVTTLSTSDGLNAIKEGRINKSYEEGAPKINIFTDLINGLKLDGKKALDRLKKGDLKGVVDSVLGSHVEQGNAYKSLQSKFKDMEVDGFILDNELNILKPEEFLGTEPINVTPENGLIGSPDATDAGFIRFTSLLRPEFAPGHRVQVQTKSFSGYYRIERVTYRGSTFGQEWYAEIEAKAL